MQNLLRAGIDFYKEGKQKEATKVFLQIQKRHPGEKVSATHLIRIFLAREQYRKAADLTQLLLAGQSPDPGLRLLLIESVLGLEQLDEVQTQLSEFLAMHPDSAHGHYVLGRYYYLLKDLDKATNCFQHALTLDQKHNLAAFHLAVCLKNHGNFAESLALLVKLKKVRNFRAKALEEMSTIYLAKGELIRAKKALETFHKDYSGTFISNHNLGLIYFLTGEYSQAIPLLREASKDPSDVSIQSLLYAVYAGLSVCNWRNLKRDTRTVIQRLDSYLSGQPGPQIPIYILNYLDIPRAYLLKAARSQGKILGSNASTQEPRSGELPQSKIGRLKVGYISTKFNSSATGVLFQDVFGHHDKDRFEIFGYSLSSKEDHLTKKFQQCFDRYRNLAISSNENVVKAIRDDRIDILIVMEAYADQMRMEILAARPAQIQINWEGYNETIGADFIQYSILDETLNQKDTREFYHERIIQLPGCAMFSSPMTPEGSWQRDYELPSNAFVFGSFNHPKKITPTDVRLWASILTKVPNSILVIFDNGSPEVRANLVREFRMYGRFGGRLRFTGKVDVNSHWLRFSDAHLFLDTGRVNAHTTAIEALRQNLPVLTIFGDRNYNRYGGSILMAMDLPELVAYSPSEYVQKAVKFSHPEEYQNLMIKLRENGQKALLFDTSRNVKYLEKALTVAWETYTKGIPPEDIIVER